MKNKKTIIILTTLIVILSSIACIVGLFSDSPSDTTSFKSIYGEDIEIYGRGIYKHDSAVLVAQGKAQDAVTLFICVPALIILLFLLKKNSIKVRLLLTGVMGYFLYSFISYVFLWSFNYLFLLYVAIMSLSFFTFILLFNSISLNDLSSRFSEKFPIKLFGIFQIVLATLLLLMWLKVIMPGFTGHAPNELEHYTTLVIQGLDLGFVIPITFISGLFILKRKPIGYLLTSIVMIKGATLLLAIFAMIINQYIAGFHIDLVQTFIFTVATIFAIVMNFILIANIKE